jgi:hypothetical protein
VLDVSRHFFSPEPCSTRIGSVVSGFEHGWTRARSGGKAIRAVHGGGEVGETKIDWLFGTVDPHVLYIITIATNSGTNSYTSESHVGWPDREMFLVGVWLFQFPLLASARVILASSTCNGVKRHLVLWGP